MEDSLGKLIANRRKHLRLTQEELASRMYVSKSAVAKWESDGGIPERDNLYKLSEIIGVSVEDMYHFIVKDKANEADMNINITAEVISLLESYGYKVIRPKDNKDNW